MISKNSIGSIAGAIIGYCLEGKLDKSKDRGEVIVSANCFGNKKQLIQQFNDQKNSRPSLKKAIWHSSFSFAPEDRQKLNDSTLIRIAQDFAYEFGFEQYVAIRHTDTEERFSHFHFIGNRVNLLSKTVSDSNNYKRVTAFCRKTEQNYSLAQVLDPKVFMNKEERRTPRKDNRKDKLKQNLQEILITCKTIPELKERLNNYGYKTEIQRGIAFFDEKMVKIKGSQLNFSLERIKNVLQENLSKELNIDIPKGRTRQLNIEI